jgi:hypothetical protein
MVQPRFNNAALVELWRRPSALPWGTAYTALRTIVIEAHRNTSATGCALPDGGDADGHVWPVWCWLVSSAPAARIHAGWDARQLRLATEQYLLSLFGGVSGLAGGVAAAQRHHETVLQVLRTDVRFTALDRDGPWMLERWDRPSNSGDSDLVLHSEAEPQGVVEAAPPTLGDWLILHLGLHQRPMSAWELTMSSISAFDGRSVVRRSPGYDEALEGSPRPPSRSTEGLLDVWASTLLERFSPQVQRLVSLSLVFHLTPEQAAERTGLEEHAAVEAVRTLRTAVAALATEQSLNSEEVMAFVLALKDLLAAHGEPNSAGGA